ncbi:Putative 3-hydroxyacyl-CoA dehydrogenase oxidoreductase [Bordetella bronchiseptica Bbr77]|nr:Putative 3-hydroxyacyl-CoA dehydrogenase oxidoreductase [Bordetella bronchiseptica Bbr77]
MSKFVVKQAAVLGAGVMGAQIAAHLANAGVPVMLYDLTAPQGERNAVVHKALAGLRKLEPAPLARPDRLALITPANYDDDLERLGGCDLVIEAIAERLDWKTDLYHRIAAHVAPHAIVASNTSGLSIETLAGALPEALRPRFCGIHFFNPPRYMRLVEIIATRHTRPEVVDQLEGWLTSRLGKGVIRALDTPNFVANRIGVFSILAAMHHTQRLGLGFDEVDALTGPKIGRPKSATYRTADVVGLDTLAHVVATMRDNLPDDPWHAYFELPAWLQALIDQGALGQKSGAGVYRKAGKEIQVLDPASGQYRPSAGALADETAAILKERDPARRLAQLRASAHPQAQFVWSLLRDIFHYSACQLAGVADNARDLDLAMRWGFGWAQGPFETWQAAGWQDTARAIAEDIAAGRAMSAAPAGLGPGQRPHRRAHAAGLVLGSGRPAAPALGAAGVPAPAVSREAGRRVARAARRNRLGSARRAPVAPARAGRRHRHPVGHLEDAHDRRGSARRHPAGHRPRGARIRRPGDVARRAVRRGRQPGTGLPGLRGGRIRAPGSHGRTVPAHLAGAGPRADPHGGRGAGHGAGRRLRVHHACQPPRARAGKLHRPGRGRRGPDPRRRRQQGPGGARRAPGRGHRHAGRGVSLSAARVPEHRHRPGRQERPAGHGHGLRARRRHGGVPSGRAAVGGAAPGARRGRQRPRAAPAPRDIPVAGRTGIANFEMVLVNMREGGMISAHDYRVARSAAVALCGGEVEAGTRVDEQWLLAVERREFMALLRTPETQARIRHTLDTGKPLRN